MEDAHCKSKFGQTCAKLKSLINGIQGLIMGPGLSMFHYFINVCGECPNDHRHPCHSTGTRCILGLDESETSDMIHPQMQDA